MRIVDIPGLFLLPSLVQAVSPICRLDDLSYVKGTVTSVVGRTVLGHVTSCSSSLSCIDVVLLYRTMCN